MIFCIDFLDECPDKLGRRKFFLTWKTDYTPSIPRPHVRGQIFFARPEEILSRSQLRGELVAGQGTSP